MNWLISFLRRDGITRSSVLQVGTRINGPHGMGTVMGGSLHIKYDNPIFPRTPNDRTMTHNLDDFGGKDG